MVIVHRHEIRRGIAIAFVLVGMIGVVLLPWVVRNALVFGTFIPLTTQSCPPCTGIYNNLATENLAQFGRWHLIASPAGVPEPDVSQQRKEMTLAWIRANPGLAAAVALSQPILLWVHDGVYLRAFAIPSYYLLLLAAIVGLRPALRGPRTDILLWVLLSVTLTLTALLTIGEPRHRVVLHPFLAVLAAVTLVRIMESRRVTAIVDSVRLRSRSSPLSIGTSTADIGWSRATRPGE
jgi:hypothetical protein